MQFSSEITSTNQPVTEAKLTQESKVLAPAPSPLPPHDPPVETASSSDSSESSGSSDSSDSDDDGAPAFRARASANCLLGVGGLPISGCVSAVTEHPSVGILRPLAQGVLNEVVRLISARVDQSLLTMNAVSLRVIMRDAGILVNKKPVAITTKVFLNKPATLAYFEHLGGDYRVVPWLLVKHLFMHACDPNHMEKPKRKRKSSKGGESKEVEQKQSSSSSSSSKTTKEGKKSPTNPKIATKFAASSSTASGKHALKLAYVAHVERFLTERFNLEARSVVGPRLNLPFVLQMLNELVVYIKMYVEFQFRVLESVITTALRCCDPSVAKPEGFMHGESNPFSFIGKSGKAYKVAGEAEVPAVVQRLKDARRAQKNERDRKTREARKKANEQELQAAKKAAEAAKKAAEAEAKAKAAAEADAAKLRGALDQKERQIKQLQKVNVALVIGDPYPSQQRKDRGKKRKHDSPVPSCNSATVPSPPKRPRTRSNSRATRRSSSVSSRTRSKSQSRS